MTDNTAADDQGSQSEHVEDDVKRKFREALEKKQAHGGRDVSDHSEHGKVEHSARAKTSGAQQMFRRKSGG